MSIVITWPIAQIFMHMPFRAALLSPISPWLELSHWGMSRKKDREKSNIKVLVQVY